MTSELQERIAKSMAETRRELIARPLADIWSELALVAMKAAREPTPEMEEAGSPFADDDGPATTWKSMIDAEIAAAEGGE